MSHDVMTPLTVWYFPNHAKMSSHAQLIHDALVDAATRADIRYRIFLGGISADKESHLAPLEKPDVVFATQDSHGFFLDKYGPGLFDLESQFQRQFGFLVAFLDGSWASWMPNGEFGGSSGLGDDPEDWLHGAGDFNNDFLDDLLYGDEGGAAADFGCAGSPTFPAGPYGHATANKRQSTLDNVKAVVNETKTEKTEGEKAGEESGLIAFDPAKQQQLPDKPKKGGGATTAIDRILDIKAILLRVYTRIASDEVWRKITKGIPMQDPEVQTKREYMQDLRRLGLDQTEGWRRLNDGLPLEGCEGYPIFAFHYWVMTVGRKAVREEEAKRDMVWEYLKKMSKMEYVGDWMGPDASMLVRNTLVYVGAYSKFQAKNMLYLKFARL